MTQANAQEFPKISLVTPSFNQAKFLERTIQSVLGERYPNLEYFVIDGGSTDGSIEILERYSARLTSWISEPDKGQGHAIAKGFNMSSGQILAWLNSDDTYVPGALWTAAGAFLKNPSIDLLYGNYNRIDENDQILEVKCQPRVSVGVVKYAYLTIMQPAAFWRRAVYEQVGGIDTSLRFAMDYDLFVRMLDAGCQVHRLPLPLANFRIHSYSKTTTLQNVCARETTEVQARYCRFKPRTRAFTLVRHCFLALLLIRFVIDGCMGEKLRSYFMRRYKEKAA